MVNKMNRESLDLTAQNIARLKELFPEILTDGNKIDFDMLKTVLGEVVDTELERYQFTWYGKKKMIEGTQKPSKGTLRPVPEKSKNFDTTENLYIEGDNLEVLKLLQKSYNGKIKMIYIDPPYNTGKDFVYKDNFHDGVQNYLEQTGQIDGDGNVLSTNTESNGRFHTDWLNLIYPRLKLARNLLTEDGVIFISIDEKEITNLNKICDEIFGAKNYLETFHIQVRYANKSLNEDSDFQPVMEYILIYTKNKNAFVPSKPSEPYDLSKFCFSFEEKTEGETLQIGNKTVTIFKAGEWEVQKHETGRVGLLKETWASGSIVNQKGTAAEFLAKHLIDRKPVDGLGVLYKIHNMGEDGLGYRYVTGPLKEDAIRGKFYTGVPLERLEELEKGVSLKYRPITNFYDYSADFGNIRYEGGIPFNSGKKPIKMLQHLLYTANLKEDDIVMDFFSGSASFAHAVMQYNVDNNKSVKYILAQIPEKLDENLETYKEGFLTICDIGEERIRRAGEKIKTELKEKQQKAGMLVENVVDPESLDIGFKVLKLDTSNIREWNVNFENLKDELDLYETPFIDGRSELDIVYEIMLKQGLELTYPIETFEVNGKTIFDIAFGNLFICLSHKITTDIAKAIIVRRDEHRTETSSVIFSDAGFSNDSDKLNCIEILKDAGYPEDNLLTI
nr:site-specific DNA-methyltransferase [uncultured Lysinibacillus sp.]